MSWSLNEVEATVRKAARGAGYSWGMAEEAGRAVRWLCAHSVDGCGAFLRALMYFEKDAGRPPPTPHVSGDTWSATEGPLCPLILGVALSDRAMLMEGRPQHLKSVLEPLMLLPFAAHVARVTGTLMQVRSDVGVAVTDGVRLGLEGTPCSAPTDIIFQPVSNATLDMHAASRAAPEPDVWVMLNRVAARTYAPATEASRLKGAGAGTSDND